MLFFSCRPQHHFSMCIYSEIKLLYDNGKCTFLHNALWIKSLGLLNSLSTSAYGRIWQAMTGYGRLWQAMAAYNSLWQAMTGYGRLWQAMAGYGRLWQAMAGYGRLWQPITAYGRLWQAMAGLPCQNFAVDIRLV